MARRVYLHIGAPKSGTSYLQDRLARNRPALARQGLLYPETRRGDHFQPALDLIQRPWAGELNRAQGQWQPLADTARKADDHVVLSHEILAAATPEQVQHAFDTLGASSGEIELHLVLTVRDLARQLPAEWQEMVKHRSVLLFAAFMDKVMAAPRTASDFWFWRVQSVPDVLTRWASGMTPDRVHVVTVPAPGAPSETLWERFGSVLGLDPEVDYEPGALANASLGLVEVSVLRRLNRRLRRAGVSRQTYVPMVRELIAREVFAAHEGSETAVLPPTYRSFVDEVTEEWLDWLAGSGVDVVGDLDDLRPVWVDSGPGPRNPDKPPAGKVAQAAIEALAAVLIELDGQDDSAARRLGRRLLGS